MWEFRSMNSDATHWLPEAAYWQNSMVYPASTNQYGRPFTGISSPGIQSQGSFLRLSSVFLPSVSTLALNPANISEPDVYQTQRLLDIESDREQKTLAFSSEANPFHHFNPALPSSTTTMAYASDDNIIVEDEMHEDTEEINALLYSESEYLYNEEESSTGHSPLDMEEEEATSSYHLAKRHKLDSTNIDYLLTDTASSAISPPVYCLPVVDRIDQSFISCCGNGEEEKSGNRRKRDSKREKIQATVRALKRIIPGGKGNDTASILDEAIRYINLLKVRATAMGAIPSTL